MRAKNYARGHSRKPVVPTLRSIIDGKPAHVSFLSDGLKAYDSMARKYLEGMAYSNKSITTTFKIDKL